MANIVGKGATFSNISATTATFDLLGGLYGMATVATYGGGSVALSRLGPDGSTYVTVMSSSSADYQYSYIPSGTYRITITTATAVYVEVAPIVSISAP